MSGYFHFLDLVPELRLLVVECLVPRGTIAVFVPGQCWECRRVSGAGNSELVDVCSALRLASTNRALRGEVLAAVFASVQFHMNMELQAVPGAVGMPFAGRIFMSSSWPLPSFAAVPLGHIRHLVWTVSQEEFACLFAGMTASEGFGRLFESLGTGSLTVLLPAGALDRARAGPTRQRLVRQEDLQPSINSMLMERDSARVQGQVGFPVLLPRSYFSSWRYGLDDEARYPDEVLGAMLARARANLGGGASVEFNAL